MATSTARKVAYNAVAQSVGRVLVAVISIFTLKLSTQYLGPSTYGNVIAATSFITLFSVLTDWGLNLVAVQEIAKDESAARTFIGINLAMRVAMSLALLPVVAILGFAIYHSRDPQVAHGINLLLATLVLTAVQSTFTAIFVVRTRNDITAAIEVVTKVAAVAGVLIVIHFDLGYSGYIIQSVILVAIATGLTVLLARRYVVVRPVFAPRRWTPLFVRAVPLGLVQIVNTVYYKIDSVMLSVMRKPAEVGYYGIAYRIIDLVMAVPGFFMLALMPALVRRSESAALASTVQKAFDVMATLAIPLLAGSLVLSKQIVVAVSGAKYAAGGTAFAILMVGAAVSYINAVFGNTLVAVGLQQKLVPLSLVVVSLNIVLNLLLIPPYGIAGAGVATSAAEVVAMVYVATIFRRATGARVHLRQVPKAVGGSAAMLAVWAALHRFAFISSGHLFPVAATICLLTAVYLLSLWALRGLPTQTLREVFRPS